MKKIALFGSGKIGETIALLLSKSERYSVRVCDINEGRAKAAIENLPNCEAAELNLADAASARALLNGCEAVISALPFDCNPEVAGLAHAAGIHYLDLTEDVATTKHIASLASTGSGTFIPQCGLAPGFISIAAEHLVRGFESVDSVKMRVGALPIYPTNRLKYNLTWSTEGLINEYINSCEAIENGNRVILPALEGYERFSLDGVEYEAFNTSGGIGSLCDSLAGKVRSLNYKTIRFPGHRDAMMLLLHDLGFAVERGAFKALLEKNISSTVQDMCVILVEVTGTSAGRFIQKTYASVVYNQHVHGVHLGAIQLTTASGICGVLDMLLTGKLSRTKGLVQVEEISLKNFLDNEFGKYYRDERALASI